MSLFGPHYFLCVLDSGKPMCCSVSIMVKSYIIGRRGIFHAISISL